MDRERDGDVRRATRTGERWFLSPREKALWWSVLAVQVGIYSTLPFAGRLIARLRGWFPLELVFLSAFLVLMSAVAWGALSRTGSKARRRDLWLVAALTAVAALLFTRTGIPLAERSHLIEYGLVAVLIFHALDARRAAGGIVHLPAALAVGVTASLGLVDEAIQGALPTRVFDPRDLLFNTLAGCMTVGMTVVLRFASHRWRRRAR